jgi:hypothetical protein
LEGREGGKGSLKDGLQVRSPSQNSKGEIRSCDWSDGAINPRDKSCPDPSLYFMDLIYLAEVIGEILDLLMGMTG